MIRLTRKQSREVDRIATEEYGIPSIVLMENAARSIVEAIVDLLPKTFGEIGIVCGPGNNGGDGLALARHLRIRGFNPTVILTTPPEAFKGDAAINLKIAQKMLSFCEYVDPADNLTTITALRECELRIDAIFGTGLCRPLGGELDPYIETCNGVDSAFDRPVIAIDLPTGLDCDSGLPLGRQCIRAIRTVTMGTEKIGFANPAAREFTGEIVVADVGVPKEILQRAAAVPA